MTSELWSLVSSAQMRALDLHTIETLGVSGDVLMESAGRAVVEAVLPRLGPRGAVVVVCGAGNNGGDGLVVARHLHALGVPVRAAVIGGEKSLGGDASTQLRRAKKAGVPIETDRWRAPAAGVLVDAIFGTGLTRDVAGPAAASIRRINHTREARDGALAVVAIDLPSGVCADTGQVRGSAIRADATVTISLPKIGLALEPGRSLAGRVVVARIGIADEAPGTPPEVESWTRAAAGRRLPRRAADGHKGSFGHALIVAGSEGKTGAAALAAEGAARMGAGLVTIACPAGLADILEVKCTEAMTAAVSDTSDRSLAASAGPALVRLASERDGVGLGPGLGRGAETVKLVRDLVPQIAKPLVLDADGLIAFAGQIERLAARRAATVLTPHPGEAGRLLGVSSADVNRDRVGVARRLAELSGAVVLLKGAGSVIAEPSGRVAVNPTGGPALGSGGTGDVLLGLVTSLLVQGCSPFDAAVLAAFVHGAAADRIAERGGSSGLLAGDLAGEIPATCEALRRTAAHAPPAFETRLASAFPEP